MESERFLPQEVIRRKRDGETLDDSEIETLIEAVVSGSVTDSQIAAFSMAVFFQGMDARECSTLSLAMRDSGSILHWDQARLHGPVIDKHSTGGVGDCVSLMLAPMLAACNAHVPMISGRGLGHSGGTLDKLASIPGYCIQPDVSQFQKVVEQVGCAIVGQSASLAPADGRIYAIRDVTATVESVPLITASILSKKLAAGIDALVMDVKTGNGAFAETKKMAFGLADSIVRVASQAGVPTVSLVTDMSQPLAPTAGNALEVFEALRYLTGEHRDARLNEVVISLGSELLVLCGLALNKSDAVKVLEITLEDGSAAECFSAMIRSLGGPDDLLEQPEKYLPLAPVQLSVKTEDSGIVTGINTRGLGLVVVALGGGRVRPDDQIDVSVGLSNLIRIGHDVSPGMELAVVHARTEADASEAKRAVLDMIKVGSSRPKSSALIGEIRRGDA